MATQMQKIHAGKSIQLEVNVSIGKNRYVLQVEKCSQLHEEVQKFLRLHSINLKYQGPILAMVREVLAKKDAIAVNDNKNQFEELERIKMQMEIRRKIVEEQERKEQEMYSKQNYQLWHGPKKVDRNPQPVKTKQNKQNYPSQYNSNSKHGQSTEAPGRSEAESHVRETVKEKEMVKEKQKEKQKEREKGTEEAKCQDVYQRWKVKQKAKQKQRIKNVNTSDRQAKQKPKQQPRQKSQSQKTFPVPQAQPHSPDHFYQKGQKFKQAKEIHIDSLYKEQYPFQLHRDASLTPTKKQNLHQKLYKDYEIKEKMRYERKVQNLRVQEKERESRLAEKQVDKYRMRVEERDQKIDQALGYLIQNGMIGNPSRIQNVSKSPFRKTIFPNP